MSGPNAAPATAGTIKSASTSVTWILSGSTHQVNSFRTAWEVPCHAAAVQPTVADASTLPIKHVPVSVTRALRT
ncbi:hypothetical protein INR49_023871 [Caranx melampygus]|nr:hypothetical protein INR49_023871 [Caranx melampygus]